jgi:hypothetical protein
VTKWKINFELVLLPVSLCVFLAGCRGHHKNPAQDSARFDADGTAHVVRVVPMPSTISPEAQTWLASLTKKSNAPQTLEERRKATDEWQKRGSADARQRYPVNIEETTTAGVRTDIITPLAMPDANRGRVLINLHGGGFNSSSGARRGCGVSRAVENVQAAEHRSLRHLSGSDPDC